jgi:hypothetical protein
MTGLVRKASLFAVCGLLAASAAMASVPSPANSVSPPCVALVGSAAGVTDPAGNFTVTVRDISNFPINNSLVVVDLSACHGLQICTTQPGLTSDCATQTVRGFTGPAGTITLAIAGHGNNSGDTPPYNLANCGKIYADGVLLGSPSIQCYDHNGSGMGPADLSAWLGDFFGSQPNRSDYDCTGSLGPADLSAWLTVFFASNSTNNCPATGTQCVAIP